MGAILTTSKAQLLKKTDEIDPDKPMKTSGKQSGGPLAEGVYSILNGSGSTPVYAVDVISGSYASGTEVTLYENNWDPWQQYSFKDLGDGEYAIIATHSDKVLTAASASDSITQETAKLTGSTYDPSQRWTLQKVVESDAVKWRIYSAFRNMYMDVEGGNAGNSVAVRLYQYVNMSSKPSWY